jgi:hypothetical protein
MLEFTFNSGNNMPLMLPDSPNIAGLTLSNVDLLCNQPDLLSSLMSVADETNQNLSPPQKELLLWHWELGHANFNWIQPLASIPSKSTDRKQVLLPKHSRLSSL